MVLLVSLKRTADLTPQNLYIYRWTSYSAYAYLSFLFFSLFFFFFLFMLLVASSTSLTPTRIHQHGPFLTPVILDQLEFEAVICEST